MDSRFLNSAKVVATPTQLAWSQAYSAGTLFAVLSLKKTETPSEDDQDTLNQLGKAILNTLEEEYFTLEEKTLASIKNAALITLQKIPSGIYFSFTAASVNNSIFYGFAANGGRIVLRRNGIHTPLIHAPLSPEIKTISGHITPNDLFLLETNAFHTCIPDITYATLPQDATPSDIAELCAPLIHEKENADASALLFSYHGTADPITPEKEALEDEIVEQTPTVITHTPHSAQIEDIVHPPQPSKAAFSFPISLPSLSFLLSRIPFGNLSHRKKILLSIATILTLVLITTSILSLKSAQDAKINEEYQHLITEATTKYEEGENLISLNTPLGIDTLKTAQKLLLEKKDQFKNDSAKSSNINTLLSKIDEKLDSFQQSKPKSTTEVELSKSSYLKTVNDNPKGTYLVQSNSLLYLADSNAISTIEEETRKKIITNDNDWDSVNGLGEYSGNLYLLDAKNNTILKYVPTNDDYGKRDYLASGVSVDFSKAIDLAIDNSLWVLFSDGSIQKFLRGEKESFSLTGLDTPLKNPTKLYTNPDIDNTYILDTGNSRIVVVSKSGKFLSSHQSPVIKDARDFEVKEKDKKILILSKGKLFEISTP